MPDEIKLYADIHADTAGPPSDEQWDDLAAAAKDKPFAAAIIDAARAAHNLPTYHKRSQGAGQVNRHAMLSFEIRGVDVDALEVVLNNEAVIWDVSGSRRQKFEGVLTAELRQSAVNDLGFSQAQADKISVTIIEIGKRATAEATTQTYINVTNDAVWHEAE